MGLLNVAAGFEVAMRVRLMLQLVIFVERPHRYTKK
jgi:hypothetical protein